MGGVGLIPGKAIRQAVLLEDHGTVAAVPDTTDTEISHALGTTPTTLILTPLTTGVIGHLREKAKSATSVTVRASISGVDSYWKVLA